jgi:beta-N-acetylhexosaminidase
MKRSADLLALADAVILPGFVGDTPPDWVRRRLAGGLAGVVLFSRNIDAPEQVARLTAALRAENPDTIVAIDEESGEVTRLEAKTGSSRPGNYALGVVDDTELTWEIARDLGEALAAIGVTLDFAPSADVNSNPDNPVIGLRSFGAGTELVARHTAAWVRGMQSAGVAACAKHFPGHGDTSVDSHHAVPLVAASREQIHEVALPPFRAAIDAGVAAIMSGHLVVTAYDGTLPATLSRHVLSELLRGELGFDGPVITDGIEMAAVSARYGVGGASAAAIAAGADGICVGGELADEGTAEAVRDTIADAVADGAMPEHRLAEAAARMRRLGRRHSERAPIGLVAARRAIKVTRRPGAGLPLPGAPHVIELAPRLNLAIDRGTPWGVGEPLGKLLPGTTVTRLGEGAQPAAEDGRGSGPGTGAGAADPLLGLGAALEQAEGRPLVIVVRDAHRHPWEMAALDRLLSARPDAVVVEMGLPGRTDLGAAHIATHGSARVSGQAAAEILAGRTG